MNITNRILVRRLLHEDTEVTVKEAKECYATMVARLGRGGKLSDERAWNVAQRVNNLKRHNQKSNNTDNMAKHEEPKWKCVTTPFSVSVRVTATTRLQFKGGSAQSRSEAIAVCSLAAKAPDLLRENEAHKTRISTLEAACRAADNWLLPYPENPNSPHTDSLRALMDQLRAAVK